MRQLTLVTTHRTRFFTDQNLNSGVFGVPFLLYGGFFMIRSTEEFRAAVKAARRVGTPLVAVRTADPASAITQVCASVNGKKGETPFLIWDFIGGLQGRNDGGKSAIAKVLGENS